MNVPDLSWRDLGACAGAELTLFYPEPDDRLTIRTAKAICDSCDVQDRCRRHAMDAREPAGVWGGLDERERRRIWRSEGRRLRY